MLRRLYWFSIEIVASLAPTEAELRLRLGLTDTKLNCKQNMKLHQKLYQWFSIGRPSREELRVLSRVR